MATRRELLEADSFHRRRLVAAFLSGARGPDSLPVRSGRTVVGGLVLAGLLVGGAAVADVVTGLPAR